MRVDLFLWYSPRGKWLETGIVPVARYSHPLSSLTVHCSKILNNNHPIKIKHFHMSCTKFIY